MDDKNMPTLTLMKPNRETIGELTQAYNITQESNLGEIPLLTFSLPMKVLIRHKLTDNENVIKLKEKMIVYYEYKNIREYFIVQKITKSHDEEKDELKIDCSGLGKQLAYRTLTDVRFTSKNARQLLTSVLQGTAWTIGSIAGKYEISYRSIDFSGSVLQFIYEVAEAFDGMAILNSVNRTVSLYDPKEYGILIGSPIGYGRLVQNITYESDSEEQATRLNVTGKEGITIASVTSTGMPYLEDYSYYYDLMSDSLKNALIRYKTLLDNNEGTYNTYLNQLETLRSQLVVKQGELVDLNRELRIIQDDLDVQNSQNQNNTQTLINQAAKKNQINSKTNEINLLLSQIASKQTEINNLASSLSINSNLTPAQIEELQGNFIIEADYSNEYVSGPKQLKELSIQHFLKIREPKIIVDIDIVNLDAIIDRPRLSTLKSEDLFVLGNYIGIEYELSKINVTAQIIGKTYDFENNSINLTISNITKAKTYGEIQAERIEQSINQSNSFAAGRWAYDNNIERTDEVTQILNSTWSAVEREIEAGVNNSVTINNRGIWITDSSDPLKKVVLQNGVIGLTNDGSNSWKTAISASGIAAERLIGQILAGNNLIITNTSGSFTIDDNGATATDMDIVVTNTEKTGRILISPSQGFKIQKNTGTTANPVWSDQIVMGSNGDVVFKGQVSIGSGNNIFKADTNGIYLGNSVFNNAPFSVDPLGNLKSSKINVTGGKMNIGNNFGVDEQGNLTANNANLSGNINMTTGNLNWTNINSDPLTVSAANTANTAQSMAAAIANGSYNGGTFINGKMIYSPTIMTGTNGNYLKLEGSRLDSVNSGTRNGISLDGSDGKIKWYNNGSNVGTISTYRGDYDTLMIEHTAVSLYGSQFVDIMAGNNIYIGKSGNTTFYGSVNFSNANVSGITARFG